MTPTLVGRLQTRLALAVVPGLPVTAFAAATLDKLTPRDAFVGLVVITVLGLGWDLVQQALQERRWDRDWPRLFALASWLPEAYGSWLALHLLGAAAPVGTHLAFFTLVWGAALATRALVLPVLLPHWRHEGQRLVGVPLSAGPAATGPAAEPASGQSVLGALGLTPRTQRFATLALCLGIIGALVLIAPLLDRNADQPAAADQRLTTGAGYQSASSRIAPHIHEDGDVHMHDKDGKEIPARHAAGVRLKEWDTTRRLAPAYVEFKGAGVATALQRTRMKPDGVLVTPEARQAAWFNQGAAPGQRGPAVLIGSTESAFEGIDQAKAGQLLRVVRVDGSQINFEVDTVRTVDARDFPTQTVYGADPDPLLRLVGYDDESGRNTIVFAHAVSMVKSPLED